MVEFLFPNFDCKKKSVPLNQNFLYRVSTLYSHQLRLDHLNLQHIDQKWIDQTFVLGAAKRVLDVSRPFGALADGKLYHYVFIMLLMVLVLLLEWSALFLVMIRLFLQEH